MNCPKQEGISELSEAVRNEALQMPGANRGGDEGEVWAKPNDDSGVETYPFNYEGEIMNQVIVTNLTLSRCLY